VRLAHLGGPGLRVELEGGLALAIDPPHDPGEVAAILCCWNEAERLQGALEATRSGRRPRVVALPAITAWLGEVEAMPAPVEVGGVRIEAEPYRPVPWATAPEALRKLGSSLRGPLRAARRLATRARLPSAPPVALRLTLPDGRVLVHLSCALHRGTPHDWVARVAATWGGADWLVAGWDYGEELAFRGCIRAFQPRTLVLADLVGDVRRGLGMPCDLLSPTADRLCTEGQPTLVLASGTALRFG
jgi:hypothetical protein